MKGITQAMNESIGGEQGRQKLDEIVDNIRVLTAEFRAMAQENHGAINHTLANVQALSTELQGSAAQAGPAVRGPRAGASTPSSTENRPEMKGMMSDIRKLAQSFQGTSENSRSITDSINQGEGTIGKLLNDETTVKKINKAVDNVNNMLGGLNKMEFRLDMDAAQWTKRGDSQGGPRPRDRSPARTTGMPRLRLDPGRQDQSSTQTVTQVDRHRQPSPTATFRGHHGPGLHRLRPIRQAARPRGLLRRHRREQGGRRSRIARPGGSAPDRRPRL